MSMEWFNRVTGELQDQLNSICEEYDQTAHMTIHQSAKHPRIEFYVEVEDDERDYFCTLLFDPNNTEFYVESFDLSLEQPARIILHDFEAIVDAVHESFHDFMDNESEVYYVDDDDLDDDDEDVFFIEDDVEEEFYLGEVIDEEESYEEIDVEWETPEVTAFQIEDELEVTYQFGVDNANGDGVLRRVNRVWADDAELIEDESTFIFSKEEASTIIAMIASHMDSMTGYDEVSSD